ncbi:cytochrome b5-like [Chironomus tepperi]|uniref:cytochrome b5-like n=1 Tax=Chironomus tepperi TaxID=113505 RepID=UPI00391F927D
MDTKEFTIAEVSAHNTRNDLYMIIDDNVYDLTKFAAEHPGGEEILIEYAGKETTEAFNDIGHSQDAKEIMKKYHVGAIVEAERKSNQKKEEPKKCSCLILALSGIAIGVGLVIILKTLKSK